MLKKSIYFSLKNILILAIPVLLVSCASSSEVVSAGKDKVAISMSDTDDIGEALEVASEKAQEQCDLSKKTAVLDRTEKSGPESEAGIAYFICE